MACLHDVDANDADSPNGGDEDEEPGTVSAIVPIANGAAKSCELVYVEKLTQYHGDTLKKFLSANAVAKPIRTHAFLRKLLEDVQTDADSPQNATASTVAQVLAIVQPSLCMALSDDMMNLAVHCQPLVGVDVARPTIEKTFGPDCADSIEAFLRVRSSYAFKILGEICGDETPFADFKDASRLASVASSLSKLAGISIVSSLDRKLRNCQWASMWSDMVLVGMDGNSDDMLVRVQTFVDEQLAVLGKKSECIAIAIVAADQKCKKIEAASTMSLSDIYAYTEPVPASLTEALTTAAELEGTGAPPTIIATCKSVDSYLLDALCNLLQCKVDEHFFSKAHSNSRVIVELKPTKVFAKCGVSDPTESIVLPFHGRIAFTRGHGPYIRIATLSIFDVPMPIYTQGDSSAKVTSRMFHPAWAAKCATDLKSVVPEVKYEEVEFSTPTFLQASGFPETVKVRVPSLHVDIPTDARQQKLGQFEIIRPRICCVDKTEKSKPQIPNKAYMEVPNALLELFGGHAALVKTSGVGAPADKCNKIKKELKHLVS